MITSSSVTVIVTNKDNDTDQDEDDDFDDPEGDFDKNEAIRVTQRTQLTDVLHSRKRTNRDKMVGMHNGKRNKKTGDFQVGDIILSQY